MPPSRNQPTKKLPRVTLTIYTVLSKNGNLVRCRRSFEMYRVVVFVTSAVLLHQAHVAEGRYTSQAGLMGLGGDMMSGGGMMGGMGLEGMGMGMGLGGMGMGMGGFGGSMIDKSQFEKGEKALNDLFFKKAGGSQGGQFGLGEQGFQKGEGLKKELKGETGLFNVVKGGKKKMEGGQAYQGGKQFDKHAKKGGQEKNKKDHKKGHTVKGFKTSHQKDENTKTEEFYDEEHDEAGKAAFSGEHGEYGEKKKSEVGGKKEEKEYKAGEAKKDGQYANKVLVDKEKAEQGKYGKKKFAGEEAAYKLNKGGDAKEAGGHHEASKFSKHYPIVH